MVKEESAHLFLLLLPLLRLEDSVEVQFISVSPVPTQAHQEVQCFDAKLMNERRASKPYPLLTSCQRLYCSLFYKDSPWAVFQG